ncbi:hypothetical protein [Corynebacterium sp. CCM 9204]|uniref:hypothetical protein n=1 Tax=Corynebacterium sp. CCM 9204 TaxID=3057616 RepID=UPI00352341CC
MVLSACQTHPNTPAITEDEPAISTTNQPPADDREPADMSSATANADGSPIIFDPWEAGRNLPDPCRELSKQTLNDIGFKSNYERQTYGLNDELLGKGISCDVDSISENEEVTIQGFYSDNVNKKYIKEEGLFIRDAAESQVPNAYFYTFSPEDKSSCYIGAHTHRGRLGIMVAGPTTWTWKESCTLALKYFDKTYEATDGFSWLKQR